MMKLKKYSVLLITVLLMLQDCTCLAAQENEQGQNREDAIDLYARSAVLMDADSGRVLFGKEEDVPRPMASTTKIMTCILALELGKEDQLCTVSAEAAAQPEVHLGAAEGESYRLKDLLYSLMLESHNDTAVVIAQAIAESTDQFADLMNEKARQIGCKNTYFITPNGLDASDAKGTHSTTAEDLALILRYCISQSPRKEEFLEITRTPGYTFSDQSGKRQFAVRNHNAFLTMMDGALTGKTGFTADAGYCYTGALKDGGRTFIVALLACGWPNHKNYKWEDTKELMQYGKDSYQYRTVELKVPAFTVPAKGGVPDSGRLRGDSLVHLEADAIKKDILMAEWETVQTHVQLPETLKAPVMPGKTEGKVSYSLGSYTVANQKIQTVNKVARRNLKWAVEQTAVRFLRGRVK